MKISAKIRKSSNQLFRIILAALVYIFLYREFKNHEEQFQFSNILSAGNDNLIYIILALVLMPVNWLLESRKWQFLIQKVENVPFLNAVKAVFAGTAISIFTPNRIGDYLGRIFILKDGDRIDGTIATIAGNLAQLLVTLLMGSIAVLYFKDELSLQFFGETTNPIWWWIVILFIISFLLIGFFNFTLFEDKIYHRFHLEKIPLIKHLNLLSEFSKSDLLSIFLFSLVRYLVYTIQFYLLLIAFGIPMNLVTGVMTVSLIFISMTIIPSIAVAELGMRALVSISVFSFVAPLVNAEMALVMATSLLWLFNIALAALIGGVFIFQLKFFRKNQIPS